MRNPKKFLFLDFDGVLHPTTTNPSEFFSKNELLEKTLEKANCEIVISSSWRFHMPLTKLVSNLPLSIRALISGITGDAHIGVHARYNEIVQYLNANSSYGIDWVALDDAYYEFPSDCKNLIKCNPNTGITLKECNHLRDWFKS